MRCAPRAASPGFHAAIDLHLVEINEPLRAAQRTRARRLSTRPGTSRFEDVPTGPMLLVANEFFDALPVRQFEKTARGWVERMVGLDDDGETLRFALAPGVTPLCLAAGRRAGRRAGGNLRSRPRPRRRDRRAPAPGRRLGADRRLRLRRAALTAPRCRRCAAIAAPSILDRPGETDLSAHVDFAALAAATGVPTFGPVGQGEFPAAAGHHAACRDLESARRRRPQRRAIDAALARLIAPDQMGTLFRVLAVGDGRSAAPAGFPDSPSDAT